MCLDSYIADVDSNPAHTTIIFTLKEEAGALAETLKVFKVGGQGGSRGNGGDV